MSSGQYEPALLTARRRSRQENAGEVLQDGSHAPLPLPDLLAAAPYRFHTPPMPIATQVGEATAARSRRPSVHVHSEYTLRTSSQPSSPVAAAADSACPSLTPLTIISPSRLRTPSGGRWTGRPAGVSVLHPPLASPYNRLSRGLTAWLATHSPFSPPNALATADRRSPPPGGYIDDATTPEMHQQEEQLAASSAPAAAPAAPASAVPSEVKSPSDRAIHLAQRGFAAITDFIKMQAPSVSLVHSVNSVTPTDHRPSSFSVTEPRQVISHSVVDSAATPRSRSGALPRRSSPEKVARPTVEHGPTVDQLASTEADSVHHMQFTFTTRAHADALSEDARGAATPARARHPPSDSPTSVSSDFGEDEGSPVVNMHPTQSLSTWHSGTELSFFDSLASYGFRSDESPAKVEWLSKYVARLQQQEAAWSDVQTRLDTLSEKAYKMLTRDGIPAAYRARVWWYWLGPESLQKAEPHDYYPSLVAVAEQQLHTESSRNILKDVDRTFTSHPFFKDPEGEGVAALRRVLLAYSIRNRRVAYCQSMNFVAGFLLLFYDEQEAFWMLAMLIERLLPADYYTESMLGVQADVAVLQTLVQKRLPKVWSHLEQLECTSLEGVFTSWYLTLFIKTTPVETTLRILDSLFVEGTKILFRVALALVDLHSAEILACDEFGPLFHAFNTMGQHTYDCDALMKRAFEFSNIQRGWIEKERARQLVRLTKQYEEMEAKRNS